MEQKIEELFIEIFKGDAIVPEAQQKIKNALKEVILYGQKTKAEEVRGMIESRILPKYHDTKYSPHAELVIKEILAGLAASSEE